MIGKLTLIGAGPGDKDLITWKGIKALEEANVLLYDDLINSDLLKWTKEDAIKIYVGKRGGRASFSQSKINQLIVSYAMIYGNVARLKGGDPFIFGRGLEEIDFAKKNGLETAVIPGISSAMGLATMQDVSLTQRGIADGFWVLTASKIGNEFNSDISLAAQSNSTVVILMGVKKLNKIVEIYQEYKKEQLPVMIIQNGSMINEKVIIGNIDNIVEKSKVNNLKSPAIIVIGKVVNKKKQQELVKEVVNQLD